MKNIVISIVLLSSLLVGCESVPKKPDATITEKVVHVDPRTLEPCLPLATLPKETTDFMAVLTNIEENVKIYADCARKQRNSIKLIKEFANIKE